MVNFDVDLVVPFVDNTDPVWQKVFTDYCTKTNDLTHLASLHGARFDDFGMFRYCLRTIDKFMPWIRNIYLIVSNIEQVPDYINKAKTKIVLHKDIIPAEYLPTFNSTTIEMFIPNIDGLSEHFIYTNDDMYALQPLTKDDFFTEDGKIKLDFTRRDIRMNSKQFRKVCLNNHQHVIESLGLKHDEFTYLKPNHSFTPMVKSHCKLCLRYLGDVVNKNISAFRTEFQHNQYIYPIFEYFTGNHVFGAPSFIYLSFKRDPNFICDCLLGGQYKVACINDVNLADRSAVDYPKIKEALDKLIA